MVAYKKPDYFVKAEIGCGMFRRVKTQRSEKFLMLELKKTA